MIKLLQLALEQYVVAILKKEPTATSLSTSYFSSFNIPQPVYITVTMLPIANTLLHDIFAAMSIL